jgi:hypothetical protein
MVLAERAWQGRGTAAAPALALEGESVLRECLAAREKSLPAQDVTLAVTRCAMAGAIAARVATTEKSEEKGELAEALREAEGYLEAGYGVLSGVPTLTPSDRTRLNQAAERAARLYEAWDELEPGAGHAEAARAWRDRTKLDMLVLPDAFEILGPKKYSAAHQAITSP